MSDAMVSSICTMLGLVLVAWVQRQTRAAVLANGDSIRSGAAATVAAATEVKATLARTTGQAVAAVSAVREGLATANGQAREDLVAAITAAVLVAIAAERGVAVAQPAAEAQKLPPNPELHR